MNYINLERTSHYEKGQAPKCPEIYHCMPGRANKRWNPCIPWMRQTWWFVCKLQLHSKYFLSKMKSAYQIICNNEITESHIIGLTSYGRVDKTVRLAHLNDPSKAISPQIESAKSHNLLILPRRGKTILLSASITLQHSSSAHIFFTYRLRSAFPFAIHLSTQLLLRAGLQPGVKWGEEKNRSPYP